MDATTHTLIATGLLFAAYHVGKFMGYKKGISEVWEGLLFAFKAQSIEINEDNDVYVTTLDGKERKVN